MSSKVVIAIFLGLGQVWAQIEKSGPVYVPNDSGSCTWRGGDFGQVTSCQTNEVPTSSCGSGRDPDCTSPDNGQDYYDMIRCCELQSYTYDSCETIYGDHGQDLTCLSGVDTFENTIVEAICGSGRDEDCVNGSTHTISCCEGRFSNGERLYSAGSCVWVYGDYGQVVSCLNTNKAIMGRCGSGRDPDCYNAAWYHGILCCDLFRV